MRTTTKPAFRVARNAIRNGRQATTREDAIEAFRVALLNGTAEQRGVAADGLERLQLLELRDEARRWLRMLKPIVPASVRRYLNDPATLDSLTRRFYDDMPIGEKWRNQLSRRLD